MAVMLIRVVSMVVGVFGAAVAGHAVAEVDPDEVARQVHEQGRYPSRVFVDPDGQGTLTELGYEDLGEGATMTGENGGGSSEWGGSRGWGGSVGFAAVGSILAMTLLVLLIAALVIFVVWLVVGAATSRRTLPAPAQAAEGAVAAEAEAEAELAHVDATQDPDALARAGQLEQALAVLLVRALRATGWRPEGEGVSSTAREVLAAVPTTDPKRQPLKRIVSRVEVARYGPREPSLEDYEAARRWLAQLMPTGGPASE